MADQDQKGLVNGQKLLTATKEKKLWRAMITPCSFRNVYIFYILELASTKIPSLQQAKYCTIYSQIFISTIKHIHISAMDLLNVHIEWDKEKL